MTDSTQQQQNGTTSSDIPSSGMTLNIRMSTSTRFTIPREADSKVITPTSTTILEVKQLIAAHPSSDNCPVERQRLIFRGRILSDHDKTLEQCGVTEDHAVLHLVKGSAIPLPGGTPGGAPAAAPVGTTPPTTGGAPATPGGGMDFGAMMRQMQQMQGQGAGGAGADPASMMQQMQNDPMMQQMMQNPEMMQSILNSPLFSNPDTLLAILNSNPQMRELMDSNPQLRHILSDPAVLQQTMQAMRDPQQMQTMMRNQDLAMSQIENYPGGFSALRRMYEEVQEPMMEAMSGSGASGGGADGASGSGDGGGGANASTEEGGAMPNPWGTPSNAGANRNTPNAPSRQQPAAPGANPWASLGSSTGGGGAAGTGAGAGTFPPPAFPGMPPMNMEQTLAMLENPQMQQMMQQITSNPEMMRFMMESNPAMRQMRESNPMAAQLMENPDFMRTMMDPNTIRMMMQLQRIQQGGAAGGVPNLGAGGTAGGTTGTAVPPVAPGQLDFSSLLNPQMSSMSVSSPGGGGAGASHAFAPPQQQQPPAERYQTQVTRLVEMGFSDREANLRALVATNGNINRAVERLLSGE